MLGPSTFSFSVLVDTQGYHKGFEESPAVFQNRSLQIGLFEPGRAWGDAGTAVGAPGLGLTPPFQGCELQENGEQHPFISCYLVQHCCALGAFVKCSFLSK